MPWPFSGYHPGEALLLSHLLPLQVGTQFKTSLSSLLEILISKEPSYIRCIKPNERKEPSEWGLAPHPALRGTRPGGNRDGMQ